MDLLTPPLYCEYSSGECDQKFSFAMGKNVFFVYANEPQAISTTIERCIEILKATSRKWNWLSWKSLPVPGQIIFCEICKSIRSSAAMVCDVTTLNFNVLFELGYAIGLGIPVLPIRDTSYAVDRHVFQELGLIDTLGYIDFINSEQLRENLISKLPVHPLPITESQIHTNAPLYLMKGPVETDGAIQLLSTLKKSYIKFRAYDPIETPRLSLFEARRQVASSVGVVANLLSPHRDKARVHNAQCAIVCGMAMATQKVVVMLQEGESAQPIDYRDVVRHYGSPGQIPRLLEPSLKGIVGALQQDFRSSVRQSKNLLHELDLGDVAAENEIAGLKSYFVNTGPSLQAKRGHARLIVGRKGSGKTAIFYDVRNAAGRGNERVMLDLKPEGYQFTSLRELILDRMTAGMQQHTMVAFWNYILLCELARKALEKDRTIASRDPGRYERFRRLARAYERHDPGRDSDFSQRLLRQIDRISSAFGSLSDPEISTRLTEVIYLGDVKDLRDAVSDYLSDKEKVWLLVDNLDKGWPVRGTTDTDMLIVSSLLDATRKLQRQLEDNDVDFECLVFLRSDIYEHLRRNMPDKGKDTAIQLDWEDPEVFQEILRRRIEANIKLGGSFDEMWSQIFDRLVGPEDSFSYIVDRTLMRPRDLLQFIHKAIDVAINRGHTRVLEADILKAEKGYSEDILLATIFEIVDTHPEYEDILYIFQGAPCEMPIEEVADRLLNGGIEGERIIDAVELLIWFGFFGVSAPIFPSVKYANSVQNNLRRLTLPLKGGEGMLVIHPAFRAALDVE